MLDARVGLGEDLAELSVPKVTQNRMMPRPKPKSPTRLTMKAFLPASAAALLVPEADQEVGAETHRLPADEQDEEVPASTSISIANTNRFRYAKNRA